MAAYRTRAGPVSSVMEGTRLRVGIEPQDFRGRPLTDREREVIRGIAAGLVNKEIADQLGISEQTVKNHIARIFAKLGARGRAHAVVLAWGISEPNRAFVR